MLNYVWLGLLFLGIAAAVSTDIVESANNKYRNGEPLPVEIYYYGEKDIEAGKAYDVQMVVYPKDFNDFYAQNISDTLRFDARVTLNEEKKTAVLYVKTNENFPEIWITMAEVNGEENDLTGKVMFDAGFTGSAGNAKVIFEEIGFINLKNVTNSALEYSEIAVNIALGLIGIMALWLGIMKIAEEAGLIKYLAWALRPIMRFLFPKVPHDHPAIGSIIMNVSANFLGLGNAATPFGLKAMEELDKLNDNKGTATNAMVTFLAINTAGLTMIPATAIAIRAAAGSAQPAVIIGTAIFGSACATIVGVTMSKILEKFPIKLKEFGEWIKSNSKFIISVLAIAAVIVILSVTGAFKAIGSTLTFLNPELLKNIIQMISIVAIPAIILIFVTFGAIKKVKIYETFVEGAKEGFNVAVRIIPYLVAMLVAIGIFRAGGAMEWLIYALKPATSLIGMPAEALPMAIMRPLSGSGSLGIMAEIIAVHGPDSFIGILVSTFFGSTETTFYVLAVYFGSVNIRNTRHALAAGLAADLAGILAAVFIVRLMFG